MLIEDRLADNAATLDDAIRTQTQLEAVKAQRHRSGRPALGVAAAALVTVAGLAGLASLRSATPSSNEAPTPVATTPTVSTGPTSAPEQSDNPEDASLRAIMLSLLDVQQPAELETFLAANVPEAAIASCMAAAGHSYVEGPSPAELVAQDPRNTQNPEQYAEQFGLGVAASELGLLPTISDPNLDYVSSLSNDAQASYFEAFADCSGANDPARRRYSDALTVTVSLYRESLAADNRVAAALDAWSVCMQSAGYDFDNPQAMLESFYARMNSSNESEPLDQLFADEVAVARANVPCETAYRAVYRDVASERFDEFKSMLDSAVEVGASPDAQG